jgi:hypothetical protein
MKSIYLIGRFALIAAFCCITSLYSATRTWTGSTNSTWSTTTNWVAGTIPGTGDTVVINAGSSNYPTLTSSITITRLRLNGGSLTLGSNNLTISSSAFITGGTLNSTTGNFSVNGGNLTISGGTFSKTGSGSVSINQDLIISSGSFSPGTGTLTVSSDLLMSGGTFTKTSGNINVTHFFKLSGGTFNTGSGTLDINDNLTVAGGIFNANSGTLAVNDTLVITGGVFNANSGVLNVDDDIKMYGGTLNGGTASIGSSSTNTIIISGGTMNATTITGIRSADLKLTGGTINIAGNKFNINIDNVTLNGAQLNISSVNLSIPQDFTMISGTLDLDNFAMTVGNDFTYQGGTITDPASNMTIKNFILNVNGTFTLNFNMTIDVSFTFTNGFIKTSASNLLIFDSDATVSGTGPSNSSHVAGPVRKLMVTSGANTFKFPTGDGIVYAAIEISGYQSSRNEDYFTAQYDNAYAPYNHASKDNTLDHISNAEYWVLDRGASAGTPTTNVYVKLYYNASRSGSITSTSNLKIAKWDGITWKDLAASLNTSQGYLITTSRVTSFSPFTFGSGSSANPLPVSLLNFNAVPVDKQVKLNWSTTTEVNNKFFSVQKSIDGKTWSVIGIVNSAENAGLVNNYNFTDRSPIQGMQYYRLIQTDINGQSTTSHIANANFVSGILPLTVTLVPNPAKEVVTITLNQPSSHTMILIFNSMGMKVMELNRQSGMCFTADISSLPNGVYIVEVQAENGINVSRIIKTN